MRIQANWQNNVTGKRIGSLLGLEFLLRMKRLRIIIFCENSTSNFMVGDKLQKLWISGDFLWTLAGSPKNFFEVRLNLKFEVIIQLQLLYFEVNLPPGPLESLSSPFWSKFYLIEWSLLRVREIWIQVQ